jgi:SsrA-binding protein
MGPAQHGDLMPDHDARRQTLVITAARRPDLHALLRTSRRWVDRPDDEGVTATREVGRRLIASNRRARHDYTILKTYEAGIVLIGTEVKSLRAGHGSLAGAFVQEAGGELMLYGLHISERGYGRHGTRALHQPRRTRKLLLHRSEIDKIIGRLGDAGVTLVPLSLYFQDGWVKVEIALARGRRSFDKRQAIAQRDADREIARELSDRLRGRRRRARGSS